MGNTKTQRPPAKSQLPKIQPLPSKTFIVDNGAHTIKAGYAPDDSNLTDDDDQRLSRCSTIPNAFVKTRGNRVFMGSQLLTHVTDWNEAVFRRPVEKGYIVSWEAEKEIWEYSFFNEKTVLSRDLLIEKPEETTLVLTEAPNALPTLQRNADEIIMEEWGFGGYLRCVGKTRADIRS